MRTMASQWDKSADLFALTQRSKDCLSSDCEQADAAETLQVQKQTTVQGKAGRADSTVRRHVASACFVSPWKKSEIAQVCLDAAGGVTSEPYESTFNKLQVQPIQQPRAEDFGDAAA